MKRQIRSRRFRLAVLMGLSLALSTQLQAAPPSILDDPALVPGGSILNDPTPLCGAGQIATYDPGMDVYGQPVVPADTIPPIVTEVTSDDLVPEIFNPARGTERVRMQVTLHGLSAAATAVPCLPAPAPSRRR